MVANVRLEDVAAHAGVSTKTVSNVVRDMPNVSERTRARVQRAIDELGYRPNLSARRLATGRTGQIAVGIPGLDHPYFAGLASTISHRASGLGYRVLISETAGSIEGERAFLGSLEAGLVDGAIFSPASMLSDEIARYRADRPMVLVGEANAPLTMDRVAVDNVTAADEATTHLIEAGRRDIAFLGQEGDTLSAASIQRIEGYERALRRAAIVPRTEMLLATGVHSAEISVRVVTEAIAGGLVFDALVCRDDMAALGALRALLSHGHRVPEDVMIVGWDDVFLSRYMYPSISSVAPDLAALADQALSFLRERIDGFDGAGRHAYTPSSLVVRESSTVPDRAE